MLLWAPAGRGKTALLVRWLEQLPADLAKAFVPISIRYQTNQEGVFYQALATRLAAILGDPPPDTPIDPATFFRERVREYFRRFDDPARPCLVVIDGLDEATGWKVNAAMLPARPPAGLRIVVSARQLAEDDRDRDWLRRLGWNTPAAPAASREVRPLDEAGIADVLERMGLPVAHLSTDVDVIGELFRLTDRGDPLLVKLYVEDLRAEPGFAARLRPEDLRVLKPGFGPFFKNWFDDQRQAWEKAERAVDAERVFLVLAILGCAIGRLRLADIGAVIDHVAPGGPFVTAETLAPIERFVIGDTTERDGTPDRSFGLTHPKLGDFLRREHFAGSDVIERVQAGFLAWGQRVVEAANAGAQARVPRYLLVYYLQHLQQAPHAALDRYRALAEDGWRRACFADEGGDRNFSDQLELCWRRLFDAARADPAALRRPGTGLGGLIHIGLCLSSLRGVGTGIPPNFVAAMVRQGFLAPRQALFIARFRGDGHRAAVIEAMAPDLDETLLGDALADARAIRGGSERAQALLAVARRRTPADRPALLLEAIASAGGETEERHRLPMVIAAVTLARDLDPAAGDRAFALAARFVPPDRMPPRQLAAPLPAAQPEAAPPPVPNAERPIPTEADIRRIFERHPFRWPGLLAPLAPLLSPALRTLAVALTLEAEDSPWLGNTLAALAPDLDAETAEAVFARLTETLPLDYRHGEALLQMTRALPNAGFQRVWPTLAALPWDYHKLRIVAAAGKRLEPDQLAFAVEAALDRGATGWEARYYTRETLKRVRDRLSSDQLRRLLDFAFETNDDYRHTELLDEIAPALPADMLADALTRSLAIEPAWAQRSRLTPLLPELAARAPDQLERVVAVSRALPDTSERLTLLDQLLPHLGDARARQAIEEVHREALEIDDRPAVALALAALGEPPDLGAATATGPWSVFLDPSKADEEGAISLALIALLPGLDADQVREVLGQARQRVARLGDEARRASALIAALCAKLTALEGETLVGQVLAFIVQSPGKPDEPERAIFGTMLLFSPYLRADQRAELVARGTALMHDDAARPDMRMAAAGLLAAAPQVDFAVTAAAMTAVHAAIADPATSPTARSALAAALAASPKLTRAEVEAVVRGQDVVALDEAERRNGAFADVIRFGLLPYLDGATLTARALEFVARVPELQRQMALMFLALMEGGWGDTLGLRPAISGGAPAAGMLARVGGPHAVTETVAAVNAVSRWWP